MRTNASTLALWALGALLGVQACESSDFVEVGTPELELLVEGGTVDLLWSVGTSSATMTASCADRCTFQALPGDTAFLSARTDLVGRQPVWTGCDSAAGFQCTVQVTRPRVVTARFFQNLLLEVDVGGSVEMNTNEERCSGEICRWDFLRGQRPILRAVPTSSGTMSFDRWEGACEGDHPICWLPDEPGLEVRAVFVPVEDPILRATFTGTAEVEQRPEGSTSTTTGSPTLTEDVFGRPEQALFDGPDAAVLVTAQEEGSLSGFDAMSLCGWVRPEVRDGPWFIAGQHVFGDALGSSYLLQVADFGRPQLTITRSTTQYANTPQDSLRMGEWHHLCGMHEGSRAQLWVDGRLAHEFPLDGTPNLAGTKMVVGGCEPQSNDTCDSSRSGGTIDEVALWDRALTGVEIRAQARAAQLGPWIVTSSVVLPRRDPAVFEAHGRVFLSGGALASGSPAQTSEMFEVGGDATLGAAVGAEFQGWKDFTVAKVDDETFVALRGGAFEIRRFTVSTSGELSEPVRVGRISSAVDLEAPTSAVSGDAVYVFGRERWVRLPVADLLSATADSNDELGVHFANPDEVPRRYASAVTLDDGRILYIGGTLTSTATWILDPVPTPTWSPGPSLPAPIWRSAAFQRDGRVYLIGGDTLAGFTDVILSVPFEGERFGVWKPAGTLPGERGEHRLATVGDVVYVVGGRSEPSLAYEDILAAPLPRSSPR